MELLFVMLVLVDDVIVDSGGLAVALPSGTNTSLTTTSLAGGLADKMTAKKRFEP